MDRHLVRPRLVDLADLDNDEHDAPLNWPPAARVVRKEPPKVGERQVRFAESSQEKIIPARSDDDIREREPPKAADAEPQLNPLQAASPFVGTIMERDGTSVDVPARPQATGTSRFRAMRAVDKTHADAAAENQNRIAQMSHEDVESELADAAAFFGKDILEKLRARRAPARTEPKAPSPNGGWPAVERLSLDEPAPKTVPAESDVAELEAIRSKYFPEEPAALNPSLEWTVRTDETQTSTRFDFEGRVIARPTDKPQSEPSSETFLAGLHHHGQEQSAPGYTVDELLHLAQSSVASQRTLSLQVLGRICREFPQRLENGAGRGCLGLAPGDIDAYSILDADCSSQRARILLTACWLLADRHRSVRNAALSCLASVVLSISVNSPFLHVTRHVCTAFTVDPYLDWKWLAEAKDEPREAPKPFSEQDASYLELVQRNWAEALVRFGVIDTLDRIAASEPLDGDTAVQDDLLALAHAIATHSSAASARIVDKPALLRLITQLGCTARPWTLVPDSPPDARALEILLAAVKSSRDTASALVHGGVVDPLLRYLLLPPLDTAEHVPQHLFSLALEVFAALARYGVNSAGLREIFPALDSIGRWCATALDSQARSVVAFFSLLGAWTNASVRDPHHGDLGANWPAVRGWIKYSVDTFASLARRSDLSAVQLAACGSALEHVAAWVTAARQLEPALLNADHLEFNYSINWETLTGAPAKELFRRIEPMLVQCFDKSDAESTLLFYGCMQLIGAWAQIDHAWRTDLALIQTRAVRSHMIASLVSPHATAAGASAMRSSLLAAAVDTGNFGVLHSLGAEDAQLAISILGSVAAPEWPVLEPFFRDNIQGSGLSAALYLSQQNKLVPQSLAVRDALGALSPRKEPTDPMTESALWRSASAGLPLRPDWPFFALDDLLHSADACVFNSGTLPSEWDYSERDIVRSTLQLAARVFEKSHEITAAHIWLALSKVFLLENDQSNGRYSGLATGKDIYTDAEIESLLEQLESIANKIAKQSDTLEQVSMDVGGPQASYYEVYTDLVGLYDAISFGNKHFARAILVPIAMKYPRDYRRLLWSDYAHTLKSVRISLSDAPAAPIDEDRTLGYLYPLERDPELLGRYAHALASGIVTPEQELLYTIALHHVAGALWSSLEPESWRDRISMSSIASLLGPARDAVLAYVPPGGQEPSSERAARLML
ncbi:hypothetical protein MCUN1_002538 [Malassezia cuniculi]|uniref:RNA polymerase II-associated protein 1 n=1 Tax=Malassezia cuniculi TaxID=948313 RepID=A0AAF0EZN6_9BASI|nr:hypothetical protein MCUN1_002538 [Malassezia cuniculi]